MQYIIAGDTEKFKDCLIFVCGSDREKAEKALKRVLEDPTDSDKQVIKGHTNLRVEPVDDSEAWWLYGTD